MSALRNAALAGLGLGLAAVMPAAAEAANGYVTTDVNERAGPGISYPVVTVIPAGAEITIFGCLTEVAWCDILFAGTRGWVQGSYLQAYYESHMVPLVAYAPRLAIPIVTFNIFVYWHDYYRYRPFYRERARYARPYEGPGGVPYRKGPQYPIIAPAKQIAKGGGPNRLRHATYNKPPTQVAKGGGANRLRYATYGKGPKQAVIKARVRPAFAVGNGPRLLAKKPPPKKCVMRGGPPLCR
jgi:uncharacterized protein YraI